MRETQDNSAITFQDQDRNLYKIESLDKDQEIENGTIATCILSTEQDQPDQTKKEAIYINGTWYLKFTDIIDYDNYYIVTKTTGRNADGTIIDGAITECMSIAEENTDPTKKEAIYINNQWYITENLRKWALIFIQTEWNTQNDPNKNPTNPNTRQVITGDILKQLDLPDSYVEFQQYKKLHQQIQNINEAEIETFLGKNAAQDFKGFAAASNGESFLYALAQANLFNAINILQESKYDFQNDKGCTHKNRDGSYSTSSALYIAAQIGRPETIMALIKAGCDPQQDKGYIKYDKEGKTKEEISILFAAALNYKHPETTKALIQAECNPQQDKGFIIYNKDGSYFTYSALYEATHNGRTKTIRAMIKAGYNPQQDKGCIIYNKEGSIIQKGNFLFEAARYGKTEIIKSLLDAGYGLKNDNAITKYNQDGSYNTYSALYIAAQNGRTETIRALIQAGYNPQQDKGYIEYDSKGAIIKQKTALDIAREKKYTEVSYTLETAEGQLLYNLLEEGNNDAINAFIAKQNIKMSKAITIERPNEFRIEYGLLFLAIQNNNHELVKTLYDNGLNIKNDPGKKIFDKNGNCKETITTADLYKNASEPTKNLVSELQSKKASYTGLRLRERLLLGNSNRNSAAGGPGR